MTADGVVVRRRRGTVAMVMAVTVSSEPPRSKRATARARRIAG